jgi:DNA-binding phage protein
MAQTTSGAVDDIYDARQAREDTMAAYEMADLDFRSAIRRAVEMGVPVSQIASAAGISRERVYQIRDGRRT